MIEIRGSYFAVREIAWDDGKPRKTKRFQVVNDVLLGEIRWFAAWRKYAFFPQNFTVYEAVCMREIAGILVDLTKQHRANAKAS